MSKKTTTIPAPTFTVIKNQADSHQVSPSWVVGIVRFNEPASIYSKNKASDLSKVKDRIMVIENDCVDVQVSNAKGSFGKHCSLSMMVGEIYYPNCVAPGDWIFVWMTDYQDDADKITRLLLANNNGKGQLNDWYSGLKFAGRIIEVGDTQRVQVAGQWQLIQPVRCQAFLEFATSIYYTYASKGYVTPMAGVPEGSTDKTTSTAASKIDPTNTGRALTNLLLRRGVEDLDSKFIALYEKAEAKASPDDMVEFFFTMIFGVDRDFVNSNGKVRGVFNDAISIPQQVAMILNQGSAKKLWELYNLNLGIQDYSPGSGKAPWERFSPTFDGSQTTGFNTETGVQGVFYRSPSRCSGWVPFYPPQWDNVNAWDFLARYINAPFNEMYTSLRCNKFNQIVPTLTVRELPFGTNLYNNFVVGKLFDLGVANDGSVQQVTEPGRQLSDVEKAQSQQQITETHDHVETSFTSKPIPQTQQFNRGLFHKLPRWIIDRSMVQSIDTVAREVSRVNLVQVFGRRPGVEMGLNGISPEAYKQSQFTQGNFIVDDQDITRHGLRAVVLESQFDDPTQNQGAGLSQHWAKMKADHLFNGHLKTSGSITLWGCRWPIVEGDNCQVNGVVYHIDAVNHSGSIEADGKKRFMTVLSVSNGILASSLTGDTKTLPSYPIHRGIVKREQVTTPELPGVTDIQRNIKGNRDGSGERKD